MKTRKSRFAHRDTDFELFVNRPVLYIMHLNKSIVAEVFNENCQNDSDSAVYVFIETGYMVFDIDFDRQTAHAVSGFILHPSQVFRYVDSSDDLKAWALRIPNDEISSDIRNRLNYLILDSSAFEFSEKQAQEASAVCRIIYNRIVDADSYQWEGVIRHLAMSLFGIFTEALEERTKRLYSGTPLSNLPILVKLHDLFDEHLTQSRLPSHYADLLNITPSYLNELVKGAVGTNISLYLRQQSTKRICRRLAMTDESIRDIALMLGYEDPAYFTRIFTKVRGMTPSQFRSRYRDPS